MNLVLIFSYDAYNFIANEILGANWWAIIGTGVLALGFVVHIIYAIILTLQNKKARGSDRYASASKTPVAWSSKNMFVLGVFIVLFLVIHLYQMWYNMQFKELLQLPGAREDSAELVTEVLSNGWIFAIYIIAFVALWLHLTHGFWSALQTVGWNNTKWMNRTKVIGNVFATIICLGFMIVAIAVHFGFSNLLG
jgi:succinate dehydrogenase / fumarate reductase cytochrome b subunit